MRSTLGGNRSGIRQFWGFRDSGVQWDGPAVVFRPFRLLQEEMKRPWDERTDVCTFRGIAAPGGDYSKCNNVSAAAGAVGAAAACFRYPVPPWGRPGRNAIRGTDPNGLL